MNTTTRRSFLALLAAFVATLGIIPLRPRYSGLTAAVIWWNPSGTKRGGRFVLKHETGESMHEWCRRISKAVEEINYKHKPECIAACDSKKYGYRTWRFGWGREHDLQYGPRV